MLFVLFFLSRCFFTYSLAYFFECALFSLSNIKIYLKKIEGTFNFKLIFNSIFDCFPFHLASTSSPLSLFIHISFSLSYFLIAILRFLLVVGAILCDIRCWLIAFDFDPECFICLCLYVYRFNSLVAISSLQFFDICLRVTVLFIT